MGLAKGEPIEKDTIFEYLISKGYETIAYARADGGLFKTNATQRTGYFWIRNEHTLFETTEWATLTTYAQKDRVWVDDAGNQKVFESLASANTGNDPLVSPTWWREIENGVVTANYYNAQVKGDLNYQGSINNGDYTEYELWSVSWPGGIETLTLVSSRIDYQGDFTDSFQLNPGYYKYRIKSSAQGVLSTTKTWMYAKRYANDIEIGKNVRVFKEDFKELNDKGSVLVTSDLARAGRLSTADYLGGDFEEIT